jgi:hypothetical protein
VPVAAFLFLGHGKRGYERFIDWLGEALATTKKGENKTGVL